ncbi:MAG: DUF459 domain-containing protein [Pseudomonadota bacterium]
MYRLTRLLIALFAVLAVGLTGFPNVQKPIHEPGSVRLSPMYALTADAQTSKRKRGRTLFGILFGKKRAKKRVVKRPKARVRQSRRKTRKNRKNRTASRSGAGTKTAAAPKVEKIDDAKRVLVIGGFMAGNLASGLVRALREVPNVVVIDRSRGRSGFVRTDVVNWPEKLPELVESVKPDYIVTLLGANDRQSMRVKGKRWRRRTDTWDLEYQNRVAALGDALKATNIPYSWVGLPPVRYKSINTDYLVFNGWYAKAADSPRGKFVDVWDGFTNESGAYTRSGPDVNGQIKLLRRKDGINFTRAGNRRLAFYVEADVKRTLGAVTGRAVAFGGADIDSNQTRAPAYDPARTGKTIVHKLNDPALDGDVTLAGATPLAATPAVSGSLDRAVIRTQPAGPAKPRTVAGVSTAIRIPIPTARGLTTPIRNTSDFETPSPTKRADVAKAATKPVAVAPASGSGPVLALPTNSLVSDLSAKSNRRAGRVDDFSWPPAESGLPITNAAPVAQNQASQ